MKIAAVLCWYDEPVEFLERCVLSLPALADTLIALDGRWKHFADDTAPARSSREQEEAVWKAVHATGMQAIVHVPTCYYDSQVAKRDYAVTRARQHGADWALVIDGDEWIIETDAERVRAELGTTELDAGSVTVTNHRHGFTTSRQIRRLLRCTPGLRYDGAHNAIRNERGWLHAPGRSGYTVEDALDLTDALTIGHSFAGRPRARDRQRREYYDRRGKMKLEAH